MSPLLANIALSVLDEHVQAAVAASRRHEHHRGRARRRRRGLPNWRIVRYADDFVVLVHGTRADVVALREDIDQMLATVGSYGLSPAKTQVVHLDDGFDFLGFRIQWRRKRGYDQWYVYTFIADRPIRSVKSKIRALTQQDIASNPGAVLIRLDQILRGWSNYFRHAVCKHTLSSLANFTWWRVVALAAHTAPLELEGLSPNLHRPHRAVAPDRRRTGSRCSTPPRSGHPVPLARHPIPTPWTLPTPA